jgi:creatinine amidohydrolase
MGHPMKRYWADYTAYDFARLPRQHVVAVLPVAAIEQHGPHLPLATDRAILDGLVAATIERLPADLPAVFLPTQSVGKSDEHIRFPGTLTLSAGTLLQLLAEIGGSVAAAGIRRFVMLNSHGGNMAVLDLAARELRIAHDMVAVAANWFALGLPDEVIGPNERLHGLHAGEMETAVMLALRPDLVAMERARDFDSLTERLERNFHHLGTGPGARIGWQAQDLNPAGAVGNAAAATAETGQRIVDHAARAIAQLLEDVHRFPVSLLHNPTEV